MIWLIYIAAMLLISLIFSIPAPHAFAVRPPLFDGFTQWEAFQVALCLLVVLYALGLTLRLFRWAFYDY